MPIYEFYSPDTNKVYSFYARSLAYAGKTPRCPDGPKYRMEKLISSFAVLGRSAKKEAEAKEAAKDMPGGGPEDARMEVAMQAMEREFSGMDEDNPDPRQLGRMMRRMSELTGEKMPAEMEEMTRRLEAGEDPDKLEEKFGDQFGGEGEGEEGYPGMGEPPMPGADKDKGDEKDEKAAARRRLLRAMQRRRQGPIRDQKLYEMAEYVV